MIDGQFDVIFRGQIIRSMEVAQVKQNLVTLFKSTPDAVEKLFGGDEVVVRKSLDYATAMKYQSALKKAGALALIKEIVSDEPKPEVRKTTGPATFGAVESSQERIEGLAKKASSDTGVAESSDNTDQSRQLESSGDTTQLDSKGISEMSLAAVGTQILPDKVYEKREVDTSELSLATVGERIMPKSAPESHPQPSIDHLSLED